MRSSRRRSTPACGEGTHGKRSVEMTTRCEKSALTSSSAMMALLEPLSERAQIHLLRPGRAILRPRGKIGLRNRFGIHPVVRRRPKSQVLWQTLLAGGTEAAAAAVG